ncbi:MAG TPA: nucleotidyltransferase family protein [Thermoanaerobaculia bacterium]|jgi:hypothetical protein
MNALATLTPGAAEAHGVTMLVARSFPERIPAAQVRATTERALHIARQLRQLLDLLEGSGIDALPVKGPVLAMSVYGDVAARGASADLDLIVRKQDLVRAVAVLEANGYRRAEESVDEHDHEAWESEAHLYPENGVLVELHTELIGNFYTAPVDLDAVRARSTARTLFGRSMRVIAPEDLLLYLCLHGARHMWSRLLWVCDIAAIVRSESIDWPALIARADSIDARQRVALGLYLAHQLFDAPMPDAARPLLRARLLPLRARVVARRMGETSRGIMAPGFVTRLLSELAARETTRQFGTYVRRQLEPNARDRAWIALPRGLRWLRWLLRPIRVLSSYGAPLRRKERT